MERNWKKKLLSMFLVFALCLSMMPASALAEEAAGGNVVIGQEEITTPGPAGAVEENGVTMPEESQTPEDGKGENGDVNAGIDVENNSENVSENDAAPQSGNEAENGIALYDAGSEECDHTTVDENGKCADCGTVFAAKNTNTNTLYQSLKDALEAAQNGETVILLADNQSRNSHVNLAGGTITLNLNGKTNSGEGIIRVGEEINYSTGEYKTATLKFVGEGNFLQADSRYACICVYPGSTLDLTGWEGGEITQVTVSGHSGSTNGDGAIAGDIPAAGKIGTLTLSNLWLDLKIKLNGGSYGLIQVLGGQPIYAKSILAEGCAFQREDGTFVPYNDNISSIENVIVIKCTAHQDQDGNGYCDGCNAGPLVASVNDKYCYTSLSDAWAATVEMNDGSTVKLLNQLTADEQAKLGALTTGESKIVLDLNGFSLSDSSFNIDGELVLKDSSATGDGTVNTVNLLNTGKLDIQSDNITVNTLNVSGSGAELTRGNFNNISISAEDIVLIDLAAEGYAFADAETEELVDNSKKSTDKAVKIIEHTHKFQGSVPCTCGYTCLHEVDADGKCTKCHTQYEAKVVTADGTAIYYAEGTNSYNNSSTGLYFAMENAPDGSTVYPLREQSAQAFLEGSSDMSRILDMNGITLNDGGIYVARSSSGKQTLKLTGEGCINATVYVHENGVLRTEDWQGKIGVLGIYSGSNIKLDGGIYGQILMYNGSCAAGDILAEGYAFRAEDDSFIQYNKQITYTDNLTNVTVVKCDEHNDSDNDLKCDYCNGDLAASVTAGNGEVHYFMAEEEGQSVTAIPAAVKYANANNGTIKPLVDGVAIYNANCTIDLNDKTVTGITAGGSDLVVTGNGTVAVLDTKSGSAKLYGGSYGDISTPVEGTTLGDLLPDGYGFRKTDGSWLTEAELAKSGEQMLTAGTDSIGKVTVKEAPITKLTLTAPDITYIEDLIVTAKADTIDSAEAVTYKWYLDNRELTGQTNATLTRTVAEYVNAGDYVFRCVAASNGYVVSKEVTVAVKPADLKNATLKITNEDTLVYNPSDNDKDSGQEQSIVYSLLYNGKELGTSDYTVTGNTGIKDAGIYTLTVTGQNNYTGTKSVEFEVKPCVLTDIITGELKKAYDGTPDIPSGQLDEVSFVLETNPERSITFKRGTDYTVVEAQYDSGEVGENKTVTIRAGMLNKNYSFEGGQREREFVKAWENGLVQSIDKAPVSDQSIDLIVMNGHAATYTVDLAKMIPELTAPKTYGEITYGLPFVQMNTAYYEIENGAKVENGVLTLPIRQVDTDVEDQVGTIKVVVSTTNYEEITLTVNVMATNRLIPTGEPTLSKAELTYGDKLGNITLSGSMKYDNVTVEGTFEWETPDEKPDAAAAYLAKWIFTPADSLTYAEVSGTTKILVNKATASGAPVYTGITAAGKTAADAALTVNPGWPAGTVIWVDADGNKLDDSTEIKANTAYRWLFTPTDTDNYNTATGMAVLYGISSGGK